MGARDSERFQLLLSPILLTVRQFGQHRSMRMACKTQRQAQQKRPRALVGLVVLELLLLV